MTGSGVGAAGIGVGADGSDVYLAALAQALGLLSLVLCPAYRCLLRWRWMPMNFLVSRGERWFDYCFHFC